jgi:mannose-6-phosphate isomerase-like protein (cupin superfamily)
MTEKTYSIARIDELESYQVDDEGLTWRPVRRHFDIRAFGVNAYTAKSAGDRVVEEHREQNGHEELYVVVSGHATFKLDGEEHDAPAGTLVHCPPGTLREAFAVEPGTTVMGIGAKPGEVFEPSAWEHVFVAFGHFRRGDVDRARAELEDVVSKMPDAWQGHYNFACLEALAGDNEAALRHLERAAELGPDIVPEAAAKDEDFAALRDDERFLAITGQAQTAGSGS